VVRSKLCSDCAVRVSEHLTAALFRAEVRAANLALRCFREETGVDGVQASCKGNGNGRSSHSVLWNGAVWN
jgi:hypothetical protein